MESLDLRLVRNALLLVMAAAALFCVFFLIGAIAIALWDRSRPQFPYEMVISAAGAIYFGALATHSWRGVGQALEESKLAQTIRLLCHSVFGMFVPVAAMAVFFIWFVFQPAY
jgi:succinate dehydrogenase hydrophobic anchor subunit